MSDGFDPGLPDERFPFPAYSDGWARVGTSDELAPGDVQAIRYFGRELVLFRTRSGSARVLDAHCRHLGAHLGIGGRVDGEGLRCPFHGWCWDGEGRCTDIPYAKRIPPAARMRAWPVCERNGFVFLWHHADGRPPDEEVPEIPEYGHPEWTPYRRLRWKIRSRTYDMGENAVDDVHFRYLHGAASMPRTTRGDVRGARSNLSQMKLDTPAGPVDGSIESTSVPGMGLVYVRGICDTLIVITGTPIDGEYVDQMFSYTQRTGQDPDRARLGAALLRDLEKQMNEDVVVFEHKQYLTRPLLVPEDGPIAEYRRTARARYSGDFSRMDAVPAGSGGGRVHPKDPPGFDSREYEELASFLRSAFRARRVEREDDAGAGTVALTLFRKQEAPLARLVFEQACLDRYEVSELRAHLSKPLVKREVVEAGARGLRISPADIAPG